jgi:hypothetical protein
MRIAAEASKLKPKQPAAFALEMPALFRNNPRDAALKTSCLRAIHPFAKSVHGDG